MPTQNIAIIFIADDDPEDLALLEEAILNYNPSIKIQTFRKGDELLETLLHNSSQTYPDLIVLDYNIPPVTGPEILTIMKNDPYVHNIPKIIWSSSTNADHIRACFASGATAYFTKPFSLNEYSALAEQICAHLIPGDFVVDGSSNI